MKYRKKLKKLQKPKAYREIESFRPGASSSNNISASASDSSGVQYPSWAIPVARHGNLYRFASVVRRIATILWERWGRRQACEAPYRDGCADSAFQK